MIEFTKEELEGYLTGRLKLITNKHNGKTKLVPATNNPLDKGVTPSAKRAYYRLWYLKNREARKEYSRKRNAKVKQAPKTIKVRDESLPPIPKGRQRRKRGTLKTREQKMAANREYNRKYQARLREDKVRQRLAVIAEAEERQRARHVPLETQPARRRRSILAAVSSFLFG